MAIPTQSLQGISNQVRRCLELCQACHDSCIRTLDHCINEGGRHVEPRHLRLLMDCAQICQTSVDFMLRSSSFHERVCGVCADICESCADSCGAFVGDALIKECAELCRQCAVLCREMSVMGSA